MTASTDRSNPPSAHGSSRITALALLAGLHVLGACSKEESGPKSATSPATSPASTAREEREEKAEPAKPAGKGAGGGASATLAHQTGMNWLAQGNPEKAREQFERAVKLDPEMSEAHFELGKLLVHMSSANVGSTTRDHDVLDQGIAALEKAIELEPNNDEYAYWAGRAYDLANKKEKAIERLSRAIELNPENGAAHKRLGMIYIEDSKIELARDCFQKAVECDASDAGSSYQLGQALQLLGDDAGARAAYERAIEVDRIRPEPYLALSQILAKLGDSEGSAKAEEEFKRWSNFDRQLTALTQAANQNPKDAKALFKLGEQYYAGEKWKEALEWFQRSIYVDAKNAHAHFYCGILRRKLGDHRAAMDHLKEAEFLEPDSLDPKLELIRLYAETGDENGILEVFKKVETEAAEDAVAMRELGIVCAEVGRAEDARRFLDRAIALDEKDVESHLALAGFLAKSGDADAARAAYQKVLELDPTNAAAQAGLAGGVAGDAR